MAAATDRPVLVPCDPTNIPKMLRDAPRWAPWAAPWDPDRQKYDKVPHRADSPEHGLSNGSTRGWVTFERAVAAWRAHPHLFAGVGYLMTGHHGVVGVDLDNCVENGIVAPWAAEIVAKLDSYTEISPSGTGLHVFIAGDIDTDWSAKLGEKRAKQPGIDVYGGGARFLTVTGAHWAGSPRDVRGGKAAALDNLAALYRKSKTVDNLHVLPLPDVHDMELPDLDDLGLPARVRNFLAEGPEPGADRSNELIYLGTSLATAGVPPEVAYGIMVDSEAVMEVALSKRSYDDTKAREYLWTHHCRRGAAIIAAERQLTLDSFDLEDGAQAPTAEDDDLSDLLGEVATPTAAQVVDPMDDSDDLDAGEQQQVAGAVVGRNMAPQGKKKRFQFESVASFLQRPAPKWIIKDVLPQAELAIVFGASGSGKTFFILDMAVCISTGRAWRGLPVAGGGVAYVVAEGAGGFRDRLQAYCHQYQIDPGGLPIHVLADAPNMMLNEDVKALGLELKALGPLSVVVMDTYARVMGGGNENDAKDVNKVVANCQLIHKLTGAIVILVHHSGKDGANGARGSSALRGAADAEIEITKTKAYREAAITKMKDGRDEAKFRFKLDTVVIGMDEDGEDRTSCIVEHLADSPTVAEQMEDQPARPRSEVQARILDQLATYLAGDVERETFIQDVRAITPLPASGKESPSWKALITRPLDKLIAEGRVMEVSGRLFLPKTASE